MGYFSNKISKQNSTCHCGTSIINFYNLIMHLLTLILIKYLICFDNHYIKREKITWEHMKRASQVKIDSFIIIIVIIGFIKDIRMGKILPNTSKLLVGQEILFYLKLNFNGKT